MSENIEQLMIDTIDEMDSFLLMAADEEDMRANVKNLTSDEITQGNLHVFKNHPDVGTPSYIVVTPQYLANQGKLALTLTQPEQVRLR